MSREGNEAGKGTGAQGGAQEGQGRIYLSLRLLERSQLQAGISLLPQGTTRQGEMASSWAMLDFRKKFFIERMNKNWNRRPREGMESPSLETLKQRAEKLKQ